MRRERVAASMLFARPRSFAAAQQLFCPCTRFAGVGSPHPTYIARGVSTRAPSLTPRQTVGLQPLGALEPPRRLFASGKDSDGHFPDSWVEPDDLLSYLEHEEMKAEQENSPGALADQAFERDMGTRNKAWRERMLKEQPDLFDNIGAGQAPKYLWIGCGDSRVAPENMVDANPGEIFVHRNIANLVIAQDTNLRSVLQFAVSYLKVRHIIVCGHYECGGVKAASSKVDHKAPLESWLTHIRDVIRLHQQELDAIIDPDERHKRLVELNVIEQCLNLYKTGDVQRKRASSASDVTPAIPRIHGMVFSPKDGVLRRLKIDFKSYMTEYKEIYNLYDMEDKSTWASFHGAAV